uniref:Alpha/beta hydrolase n=1 Tax=Archaeoglobus fulgidus TaxID=2234 RepID=A0A7J2THV8_ARCFL
MKRVELLVEGKRISILKASDFPIFYIHGSGCDATLWIKQLEELGGFAIDLPNHGESDELEVESVEDYARIVAEVVDRTSGSGLIAGHSLGGAIAQMVYLKHRKVVKALILISTGARLRVLPKILEGLENNPSETARFISEMAFASREYVEDFSKLFADRAKILLEDLKICDRFDLLEDFKAGKIRFDVPTIAIVGEKDMLTPVKYSQFFSNFGARVAVIENAGHMVMLEKPKELNEIIRNFLSELRL